jgi:hypothetical protein
MKAPGPGFQANDLDASAAIDMERADALRREADALEQRATEKRSKAAELRVDGARRQRGHDIPVY